MTPEIKKRLLRTGLLCSAAVMIGAGIGFLQLTLPLKNAQVVQKTSNTVVPGIKVGGNFSLTDHTGKRVTQDDFAGKYKLIYFGFTFCPAICPTELQKITKALALMGPQAQNIQPLFITIDPQRDTVEVMREYVPMFDPRLVGLTGTPGEIAEVLKNYRVYAQKVKTPEMTDYTMDHSSFIYLMNTKNELVSIYRIEDNAEFMAEDLKTKISAS